MPATVLQPRTLYDKVWDDHVMFVAVQLALVESQLTSVTVMSKRMDLA